MRSSLALLTATLVLTVPSLASAQEENCPSGGWFCEEGEAPGADDEVGGEAGDTDLPESAPDEVDVPEDSERATPPVVVYTPDGKPPSKIIVASDEDAPRPPRRRNFREWGFNLRLEGVLMGDAGEKSADAGMGGLGFSFRYRPVPHFAFDVGLDFLGGTDWEGHDRSETALLLNGIVFFNPRSKVQVYTIGGIGFSGAKVQNSDEEVAGGAPEEERYSYFGGQLGLGLEFRIGRKTALNFDLLGFIRGRTDEKARFDPEFVDEETGRSTNTSGGGLFRGGITFYW